MVRAVALPVDERRRMIVDATFPLLLENGEMVTTRQIADAAGIAEGTIFRVFADKEALIGAVIERALDPGPLEQALREIDPDQTFELRLEAATAIIQQRVADIWRLMSSVGPRFHPRTPVRPVVTGALVDLLSADRHRLAMEPVTAARMLRALTLAVTHPMLVDEPMPTAQIVKLFLYGISVREQTC